MSFALSGPLQAAIFAALSMDTTVTALIGSDIYDAVPSGTLPTTYIRLGSETVTDASDVSGDGAVHRFAVSVITTDPGFAGAKEVSGAVSDALHNAQLTLSRGHLVSLQFERARAQRTDGGSTRQIEMLFRARVADE